MGRFEQPGNEFSNFDVNASARRIAVAVTSAGTSAGSTWRGPVGVYEVWCLESGRARSVGLGPVFRRPNSPHRRQIDGGVREVDLASRAQLVEPQFVRLVPYADLLSVVQSPPASGARAETQPSRKMIPADACLEHEQDAVERRTIWHARSAGIALRTRLRDWQQWFDQFPQVIVNDPRFHPWASVVPSNPQRDTLGSPRYFPRLPLRNACHHAQPALRIRRVVCVIGASTEISVDRLTGPTV